MTVAQLAITAASLYYLFRDPQKRHEMGVALARARANWMILGVLTYGVVEVLRTWKWKILLNVQGIVVQPLRLWTLALIGLFFHFVIPGGSGGDVVRTFYLIREVPGQKRGAVLSVLMDLVVNLFGLVILTAGCIAWKWAWLTASVTTERYVVFSLALLAGSTATILFSSVASGLGLVHKLPARMPGRERIAEFALAYNHYAKAWPETLLAIVLSVLCHLGYFATFYCAARALETPLNYLPTIADFSAILPIVTTITALPISLGGLGVREGLFQVFFSELGGVEESLAVVISSLGFLLSAFWGVVGGLLYIFYRPSEHARIGRIRDEMEALEHTVAETEIQMELEEEVRR